MPIGRESREGEYQEIVQVMSCCPPAFPVSLTHIEEKREREKQRQTLLESLKNGICLQLPERNSVQMAKQNLPTNFKRHRMGKCGEPRALDRLPCISEPNKNRSVTV